MESKLLSIIVPCHNEEDNIHELYKELMKVLLPLSKAYEIIFVNDGSKDSTVIKIKALIQEDVNVKLISLGTNYGHQVALMTGLKKCKGNIAISLDADLQHHPRYIPELIEKQKATGALVVDAKRKINTQKGLLKKFFSQLFYPCFNLLTGVQLEAGVADFRLYTRPVIDALANQTDTSPFIRGKISEMRVKRAFIDYEIGERFAGVPAYTFKKSLFMAYNSLMDYSKLPYRLGLVCSLFFMIIAFFMSLNYLYLRFFTDDYIAGNTDIIILICLGFSFTLLICGIILRQVCTINNYIKGTLHVIIEEEA